MKLCRYKAGREKARVGLVIQDRFTMEAVVDLTSAGVRRLSDLLEEKNPMAAVQALVKQKLPKYRPQDVTLLAPIDSQEIWAAGVTYERSKTARMEESTSSASAYDKVYEADRPEIFFKSMPEKVVDPGEAVGIRADARWSVPEPELALVLNSRGELAALTLGNDMSSRDIEGENCLYLPQAKIYARSCAIGPVLQLGVKEPDIRKSTISIQIMRAGNVAFFGHTPIRKLKRRFKVLIEYLCRSQRFPNGVVLLTGTGVVPPDDFTLAEGDRIKIEIPEIGELKNSVSVV